MPKRKSVKQSKSNMSAILQTQIWLERSSHSSRLQRVNLETRARKVLFKMRKTLPQAKTNLLLEKSEAWKRCIGKLHSRFRHLTKSKRLWLNLTSWIWFMSHMNSIRMLERETRLSCSKPLPSSLKWISTKNSMISKSTRKIKFMP